MPTTDDNLGLDSNKSERQKYLDTKREWTVKWCLALVMLAFPTAGLAILGMPIVMVRHLWQTRASVLEKYSDRIPSTAIQESGYPQVSKDNIKEVREKLNNKIQNLAKSEVTGKSDGKTKNIDKINIIDDSHNIYFKFIMPHHTDANHQQILSLLEDEQKLKQLIRHNEKCLEAKQDEQMLNPILPSMLEKSLGVK